MRDGNKVVVINGGGRGIGREIAKSLAKENATVIICSRTKNELKSVRDEIVSNGGVCEYFVVDVTKKTQVENFIKSVATSYGKIDVLINNAGWCHKEKPVEEITDYDYEKCIETNVHSVFYFMRKVVPIMKEKNSGMIINISSGAGRTGRHALSIYSASKFALHGLAESVSKELQNTNISCITLVLMGGFNTKLRGEIFGEADAQKQKDPKIVADVVKDIFLDKLKVPNGKYLIVPDRNIV